MVNSTTSAVKTLELDGYYVWDCSVIKAKGRTSMWKTHFCGMIQVRISSV